MSVDGGSKPAGRGSRRVDYPAAARRHQTDGHHLHEKDRLDNADHLYGFAAECALLGSLCVLHRAGVYSKLSLDEQGQVQDEDLRRNGHVKELWSTMIGRVFRLQDRRDIQVLFQRFQQHRDGTSREPFRDWSVNNRYRPDNHVPRERVEAHRSGAEACLAILSAVEQSYLKRPPSGDTGETP